jgi:hypothetical protein
MGTSQSSGGPGLGVPMVPSWVPDPPVGEIPAENQAPTDATDQPGPPLNPVPLDRTPQLALIAPPGRFQGARRSLGEFARTGDGVDMRRGMGHYIRTGYGGSTTAAHRLEGTASTAGTLYGALSSVASGQAPSAGSPLDPAILAGRSGRAVRRPLVRSRKRSSRCAAKSRTPKTLTRAAASSSASGMPSSLRQISRTAGTSASATPNPSTAAMARSTNSCTAAGPRRSDGAYFFGCSLTRVTSWVGLTKRSAMSSQISVVTI